MQGALRAITALEPDVKKTYKTERQIERLTARLRGKPKDYEIWDHEVLCDNHAVPVRLFSPKGEGPFPLLLFFHGGGWVTGGIDNYTGVCVDLVKATGCMVALPDYRLAPEYKFPAAPEDCYAVARAFFFRGLPGVDPEQITLIGDSAGGNLAAVVSLMARDRGEFFPRRQILLYPCVGYDHTEQSPYPSVRENGTDYLLTSKRIRDFLELYRRSEEDLMNPYFAPLRAVDLSNQPDTLMITAQYCPLRDEGEDFAEKLRAAGNRVQTVRIPDALHAYMMLPPAFASVRQTYLIIHAFLQRGPTHGEA